MGFLAQQRSCRARGLSVLCTRKCNSPGPLPDLALTQSLTWPPSALTDHFTQVPGSQVLLRVLEVLSGDAGNLPFYGRKRMAHLGLTPLSLPFSLSLIPLDGALYSPPQSCQSGQNKDSRCRSQNRPPDLRNRFSPALFVFPAPHRANAAGLNF